LFLALHHAFLDPHVDLLPKFVHLSQLPQSEEEGSFDEEEKEALDYYEKLIR